MYFERFESVAVIGGNEDDERHVIDADFVDDIEAIHFRNLDVEEDDIGLQVLDLGDGGFPIGSNTDDVPADHPGDELRERRAARLA